MRFAARITTAAGSRTCGPPATFVANCRVDVGDRGHEGGAEQRGHAAIGPRARRPRARSATAGEGRVPRRRPCEGRRRRGRRHAPSSTRMARARSPPSTCTDAEPDEERAAERLASTIWKDRRARSPLRQIAQHPRIGVRHPHERSPSARLKPSRPRSPARRPRVRGRDRVAVRIAGGVPSLAAISSSSSSERTCSSTSASACTRSHGTPS